MSVGWIKTEEQRERHREACRRRYLARIQADPEANKKQWAKRKAEIEAAGGLSEEDKEARRANVRRAYARHRAEYLRPDQVKREEVVRHLGAKCAKCGYDANIHALVLDHIRGDGYLDRKRVGNRIARYYWQNLDEAKQNLQVLCYNCNAIKAIENREHNRSRRLDG